MGSYLPEQFIFQCLILFHFHTVHRVLRARIPKWSAIPFSSGPHFVTITFLQIIINCSFSKLSTIFTDNLVNLQMNDLNLNVILFLKHLEQGVYNFFTVYFLSFSSRQFFFKFCKFALFHNNTEDFKIQNVKHLILPPYCFAIPIH